jgi:hypothetical protein
MDDAVVAVIHSMEHAMAELTKQMGAISRGGKNIGDS